VINNNRHQQNRIKKMARQQAIASDRQDLLQRYLRGENITEFLRGSSATNSEAIIEVAYDLQAGSYRKDMSNPTVLNKKEAYCRELANRILSLTTPSTVLEAGVGEATTLSFTLANLPETQGFGFDISWSRIAVAKEWLDENRIGDRCDLCTASLFSIPLPDNSVDVVYTSHSIEPNGGQEEAAVEELYRVASNYLILLEPAYDLADHKAQERMRQHGYCIDLQPAIQKLGYPVEYHGLFPHCMSPLNPTGITIIKKPAAFQNQPAFCCPTTKQELIEIEGALLSPSNLVAYPILAGIPCLREENGIIASRLTHPKQTEK